MLKGQFYVKSFEEDFVLKSVIDGKKAPSQSIKEIIESKVIIPNTFSFGKNKRLACSILNKNYLKTYRSQGLIFQTQNNPTEIFPFDLAILTKNNNIIVRYYKIKNLLADYYGNNLITGHERFSFKTIEELLSVFPSPKKVWETVNTFRINACVTQLPKTKYKLVEYNEAIFDKPVQISPTGIFGYTLEVRKLAKEFHLPYYKNAKEFWIKKGLN
ncbi:MAG: hypothetical protein WCW13_00715 [archaeon]|jgi:hypothetical protein